MSAVASVSSIGCDRIGMGQKGAECFVNRSFLGKSGAKCDFMQPMHPAAVHERTPRETDCAGQGERSKRGSTPLPARGPPVPRATTGPPPPRAAAATGLQPAAVRGPEPSPSPRARETGQSSHTQTEHCPHAHLAHASGRSVRSNRVLPPAGSGESVSPCVQHDISAGRSCVDDHDHRLRQQARQAQTPTRALHVAVVEFTAALPRARRRPVRQLPTPSVHAQARRPPVLPPPPPFLTRALTRRACDPADP